MSGAKLKVEQNFVHVSVDLRQHGSFQRASYSWKHVKTAPLGIEITKLENAYESTPNDANAQAREQTNTHTDLRKLVFK